MSSTDSSASDSNASGSKTAQHRLAGSKRKRESDDSSSGTPSDQDDSTDVETSDSASSGERDGSSEAEAEVLSHAAQRKRKKQLAKSGQQDVENSLSNPSSSKPATETLAKRQNSIWVGNLSFKTTPASLRSFFDGVGQVTRIHMPMKLPTNAVEGAETRRTGRHKLDNRGFAYVDFASTEAKQIAIAMSEQELDGRKLLIKDGEDFAGRPAPPVVAGGTQPVPTGDGHSKTAQKILASQKQPPAPTLFFGNLGFEATPESLQQMLDAHASQPQDKLQRTESTEDPSKETPNTSKSGIRKVRLGTFEDSGLCKGFGFVDFYTTEQATAALINPRNRHLDGRKLVVEYASADAVRRGGGPRKMRDNLGHKSAKRAGTENGESVKRARVDKEDAFEANGSAQPVPRSGKSRPGKLERLQAKGLAPPRSAGPPAMEVRKPQRRPNPGAALANAPRASAAILPTQGQKIVF